MAGPTNIATVTVPAPAPAANTGGDAYDLVSLADVKLELNIADGANDAWLAKAITRASKFLATKCNRVFQTQYYRDRIWALRDPFPWQVPSGFFPLQLSQYPIATPPSPALTAPPLAPVLSSLAGGALAAAMYYVKVTYVTATGETAASQEASLLVSASNLLSVASPQADSKGIATGWNVYVGSKSFGETKQNAVPLPLGTAWTLPDTGLVANLGGLPGYILVVENDQLDPTPLAEGVDFLSDYDANAQSSSKGWLTRLGLMDRAPVPWSSLPILVEYPAGFSPIPDDLQEGAIVMVKGRYYARNRDPNLRQENVEGEWSATYWFGAGPGGKGGLPPFIREIVDNYRVPVIA